MIRVVVADDTLLTREGVARVIDQAGDLEVVAACEDADAARNAIGEHGADVLVTDIRMPPTNTDEGIRLAGELRQTHPQVGVVVLSQHAELLYALELFDQGTEGRAYLLKERVRDQEEMHRAVRDVAVGGTAVDPRIVDELLRARQQHGPTGGSPSSPPRARHPAAPGRGPLEPGDRRRARPVDAHRGARDQRDLPEARTAPVGRRQPPGEGGAALPGRPVILTGRRGRGADGRTIACMNALLAGAVATLMVLAGLDRRMLALRASVRRCERCGRRHRHDCPS